MIRRIVPKVVFHFSKVAYEYTTLERSGSSLPMADRPAIDMDEA